MDSASEFSLELRDFWGKYSKNEPQHPFFEKVPNPDHWGEYIPVMIHGDEGRGRQKQPVLVIADSLSASAAFEGGKIQYEKVTRTCLFKLGLL